MVSRESVCSPTSSGMKVGRNPNNGIEQKRRQCDGGHDTNALGPVFVCPRMRSRAVAMEGLVEAKRFKNRPSFYFAADSASTILLGYIFAPILY